MFLKSIALVLSLGMLYSCATGHYSTSLKLREYVSAGEFDKAINYLKASSLSKDQKSALLFYTELGLLEHYKGNYLESTKALSSAKTLIDELYTTKVSGKISSSLTNDNADFYYGEKYEASLVYFYLSLNYYMQAIKEPQPELKKQYLRQARAEVVAWDSFLTEMKQERMGKALFKEDLLAKTFGALIHESQGSYNDDQIALQLYKDAQNVFFKNYNLFPTFNAYYENFKKNFSELPNISKDEVEGKYVLATDHSQAFKAFLKNKIDFLSTKLKKRKNQSPNGNISFLLQDGLIAEKTPRKYEIPMVWGAHESMAFTLGMSSKVSFELPTIAGVQKLDVSRLEALDQAGAVLHQAPLTVIAPLSELAEQAINEHSSSVATKTATRVIAKHVAAVVASAATYEAGRRQNSPVTMMLATVGHAAAVATINNSEKADVRFWSTLPSNIRMGIISVPPGKYKFRAVFGQPGAIEYRVIELGEHEVTASSDKFVMNSKHLKYRKSPEVTQEPVQLAALTPNNNGPQRVVSSEPAKVAPKGCMKDSDCPTNTVCATVRGEYPGSCAGTGLFGGFGRNLSGTASDSKGCMKDSDCSEGKVCATVRGEYPGSCASR